MLLLTSLFDRVSVQGLSSQANEVEDSPEIQDDLNHPFQGKTMTTDDTSFAPFGVFQTVADRGRSLEGRT